MSRSASLAVVLLIAACSSEFNLSEQQRRELYEQSVVMLDTLKGNGVADKSTWQKSIVALQPEIVVAKNEGLYIKTGGFFVAESGFFIPRQNTPVTQASGTDPNYQSIGNGIYRYEVKG